jgi:hypothetical protein
MSNLRALREAMAAGLTKRLNYDEPYPPPANFVVRNPDSDFTHAEVIGGRLRYFLLPMSYAKPQELDQRAD